jgi:hypothetical protein
MASAGKRQLRRVRPLAQNRLCLLLDKKPCACYRCQQQQQKLERTGGLSLVPLLSGKKPYTVLDTRTFETGWPAKSPAPVTDTNQRKLEAGRAW